MNIYTTNNSNINSKRHPNTKSLLGNNKFLTRALNIKIYIEHTEIIENF